MKKRFWQDKLAASLGEEFAEDFETLCEKHNLNEIIVIDKIYNVIRYQFDIEDVIDFVKYSDYPSLAKNEKFIDHLVYNYRKLYDENLGILDNISLTFGRIMDEPEWKEIISAAYEK